MNVSETLRPFNAVKSNVTYTNGCDGVNAFVPGGSRVNLISKVRRESKLSTSMNVSGARSGVHAEFEFDVASSNTRLLYCLAHYELITKEPWPQNGIYSYSTLSDGPWGYLYQFEGGEFVFDLAARPSDKAILLRWGGYLK